MAKSKKQLKTIDEYIAAFPKEVQDVLEKIRSGIRESALKAKEAISYGIPAFRLNGSRGSVYFSVGKIISDFIRHPQALKHSKKNWLPLNKKKVLSNSVWISRSHMT